MYGWGEKPGSFVEVLCFVFENEILLDIFGFN